MENVLLIMVVDGQTKSVKILLNGVVINSTTNIGPIEYEFDVLTNDVISIFESASVIHLYSISLQGSISPINYWSKDITTYDYNNIVYQHDFTGLEIGGDVPSIYYDITQSEYGGYDINSISGNMSRSIYIEGIQLFDSDKASALLVLGIQLFDSDKVCLCLFWERGI